MKANKMAAAKKKAPVAPKKPAVSAKKPAAKKAMSKKSGKC